ncbi:WG repeat-containing protein [Flavobacterium sp. LC2016-12]|uniref:WG repeat-containing protein n=1 Tax=Flavobacterium sp. LC2016-12 TaxID=2783794 RepID=UPI00188A3123|nr:WG repeat-containing protein [Flavobacterium sp. LC2016-12]MBF4467662.1 hypothetical protein [Flavobacterium sp. LC2016-12]
MKKIIIFLLILINFTSFSQTEKLYYFVEKDSLFGVKNQNGKIIIPPQSSVNADSSFNGQEIKDMVFCMRFAEYYDRKGNFLFDPYSTGEGPDYFQEGFIRYSENKKVGLYNYLGEKIIPAKYDWMSPIDFGFAHFCNGCYFDRSKDDEHPPLVGGTYGFVGKNGIEIQPTNKRNHPKDFETENHQFIPYQFEYSEKEKEILDFFEKRKEQITQINGFDCDNKIIYFEITEKPTEFEPFYKVTTFELCDFYINRSDEDFDDFKNFKVSADVKNFYVTYIDLVKRKKESEYVERKILVDKWITKSLKSKK